MTKVITYGTYDVLHYGHIRLLERAKALGDYLIVGVTADDFDKSRGKINVQQSLMERVEAVRATGIADEIIIEEYEGQKIDDIRRYDIDIFTVGSDWEGQFDYLNEYCKVVYLERTKGISSTDLRTQERKLRFGLVGSKNPVLKHIHESKYVNGICVSGVYTEDHDTRERLKKDSEVTLVNDYTELLDQCDALYIASHPAQHVAQIKEALLAGKHILCEAPLALKKEEAEYLYALAKEQGLVLIETVKTAYSTAYNRLLLLVKSGKIGKIVSVDAVCTSLNWQDDSQIPDIATNWNSICAWGPTALLPVFQILGTDYVKKNIVTRLVEKTSKFDAFTKIDFVYNQAAASIRVGKGVKSEGELIISGTKGYVYVPAPWWKTDYFEIRYEDPNENKRYFYQLDGEGIRYEIVAFCEAIQGINSGRGINHAVSVAISEVLEDYYDGKDVFELTV